MAEAAPHVARVVQAILIHYRTAPPEVQDYDANLLKWGMRALEAFVKPVASQAALDKAAALGVGDIRAFIWEDQTSLMKDPHRRIFHWEHIWPVSDLVKECLAADETDLAAIERIISKARIAWILKEENSRLKNHGRGDNPLEYYEKAKIHLVGPDGAPFAL